MRLEIWRLGLGEPEMGTCHRDLTIEKVATLEDGSMVEDVIRGIQTNKGGLFLVTPEGSRRVE